MFLSLKEFAVAVGVKHATLRQHIKRKKVFKSGDKIDTEYELNKIYINEQTNGRGLDMSAINMLNNSQLEEKPKQKSNSKPKSQPEKVNDKPLQQNTPVTDASEEDKIHLSYTVRKRKADAIKAENEAELKRIEIQKKMGELMPIELVERILTINLQSIFRTFHNDCENIASVYTEILGGNRTHLTEMTTRMREFLEKMIKSTEKKAASEIKAALSEYANIRSRGERK